MRKEGFTLIELLVVIAIIGLLLAVMVPALTYVKQQATAAVCGVNQAGLAKCWFLYQQDNDGRLVGLSNYYSGSNATPYRWVERPLFSDRDDPRSGVALPDVASSTNLETTHEWELNGIRAGKLYPYAESEKLYHCPADKNWRKAGPGYALYISYAGAGLMNSEDFDTRTGWPGQVLPTGWRTVNGVPGGGSFRKGLAEKMSDVTSPADKYIFVEENYYTKGDQRWYQGGFVLMNNSDYWTWWDWPAEYHKDRSTLAFADGHTEKHTWSDPRTISIMTQTPMPGTSSVAPARQPDNPDMEWMNRGYLAMGPR